LVRKRVVGKYYLIKGPGVEGTKAILGEEK